MNTLKFIRYKRHLIHVKLAAKYNYYLGPDQSLPTHGNKVGNKRALGGKSSSSSSSSSSTSDSGSSSASSSSSDSSDDSDGAHNKGK